MPKKKIKKSAAILKLHRGSFQAQGKNCQKSESWGEVNPVTIGHGNTMLSNLSNKIPMPEQLIRRTGFVQCSMEIKRLNNAGGYTVTDRAYIRSFPSGRLDRVDLEIRLGTAFI